MVHWQNVEYILRNGLCCREHPSHDPDYINIGHRQLINDRHVHPIPLDGAGNLGEYVPFYFAGHTPMLYLIMKGYQGVEKRPQADIVFLVSSVQNVLDAGLEYVFTNMNAKRKLADFFTDLTNLEKIKWDVVKDKVWKNTEENDGKQDLKQAEFLVRNAIPVDCLHALVVKTSERKAYFDQLISELKLDLPVYIDENCKLYY